MASSYWWQSSKDHWYVAVKVGPSSQGGTGRAAPPCSSCYFVSNCNKLALVLLFHVAFSIRLLSSFNRIESFMSDILCKCLKSSPYCVAAHVVTITICCVSFQWCQLVYAFS